MMKRDECFRALGLALGRPDKRIICLQGDGSLLMNLGCLVTIAAAAPKNLVHMVVQNGTYEANGSHPIRHGASRSKRRCGPRRGQKAPLALIPHHTNALYFAAATWLAPSGTTRRYPTPSSVKSIRGCVGSTSIFCRSLRTKMRR